MPMDSMNRHRIQNDLKIGTQMDVYRSRIRNELKIMAVRITGPLLGFCSKSDGRESLSDLKELKKVYRT